MDDLEVEKMLVEILDGDGIQNVEDEIEPVQDDVDDLLRSNI